jgi:hypothetical protein
VDVSVGYHHVVGLKADGSIVAWGYDYSGQLDVPAADPTFVKVAAGFGFGFAIREDGTIVPWGVEDPSVFVNYTDVAEIDAMGYSAVSFRHFDGSITVWSGEDSFHDIPEPNLGFIAVDAAPFGVAAIRGADLSPVTDDTPAVNRSVLNLTAGPNPFNPRVLLTMTSQRSAPVTLEVLDIRGHRVDELWRGHLTANVPRSFHWDGMDASGQAMPSGVYLVQARSGETSLAVRKVSLVR